MKYMLLVYLDEHVLNESARADCYVKSAQPAQDIQAKGDNFSICIVPESIEETGRLFAELGENGTVTGPLQDTFWGARFGTLTDQFGIGWMFNFEKPKT